MGITWLVKHQFKHQGTEFIGFGRTVGFSQASSVGADISQGAGYRSAETQTEYGANTPVKMWGIKDGAWGRPTCPPLGEGRAAS